MIKYILVLISFSLLNSATLYAACPSFLPDCNNRFSVDRNNNRIPVVERISITRQAPDYDFMAKINDAAQKKQSCQNEILATIDNMVNETGTPALSAEDVDEALAANYPNKCAGVHVCSKNGEIIPYKASAPNLYEKPSPYIYGQMKCFKDVVVNLDGTKSTTYDLYSPLLCNPEASIENGPIQFSSTFSPAIKANIEFCEVTDTEKKGTEYDGHDLSKYFAITTAGDLLDKMIAYNISKGDTSGAEKNQQFKKLIAEAGKWSNKNSLDTKACIFTLPQTNNIPFVVGAIASEPTIFPDSYDVFALPYGYKVSLKKMEITNVDGFCSVKGCTNYKGANPNLCTVDIMVH